MLVLLRGLVSKQLTDASAPYPLVELRGSGQAGELTAIGGQHAVNTRGTTKGIVLRS